MKVVFSHFQNVVAGGGAGSVEGRDASNTSNISNTSNASNASNTSKSNVYV